MLAYNLLKYYIVLLKNFKDSLNKNELNLMYPGLKWSDFVCTREFKDLIKEVNEDLSQNELKFANLYDQCESFMKEINEINPKFKAAFHQEVEEKSFEGNFK
jgi:uncharacterized protein YdcH (DUF465 family)